MEKVIVMKKGSLIAGWILLVTALVGAILLVAGKATDPTFTLLAVAVALGLGLYEVHQSKAMTI